MSLRSWPLPPAEAPLQDLAVTMAAAAAWLASPRLPLLELSAHPTMPAASVAAAAGPAVAAAVVAVDVAVAAAVAVGVVAAAAAAVPATAVDVLVVVPSSAAVWGQLLWRLQAWQQSPLPPMTTGEPIWQRDRTGATVEEQQRLA